MKGFYKSKVLYEIKGHVVVIPDVQTMREGEDFIYRPLLGGLWSQVRRTEQTRPELQIVSHPTGYIKACPLEPGQNI